MKIKELDELLKEHNISLSQLPKIKVTDPALPEGCTAGEVVKIERRDGDKIRIYYRVTA